MNLMDRIRNYWFIRKGKFQFVKTICDVVSIKCRAVMSGFVSILRGKEKKDIMNKDWLNVLVRGTNGE